MISTIKMAYQTHRNYHEAQAMQGKFHRIFQTDRIRLLSLCDVLMQCFLLVSIMIHGQSGCIPYEMHERR